MSEDRYEGLGLSSEELAAIDDELDDSADLTDDGDADDDDADEVAAQAEESTEPEKEAEAETENAAPAEAAPVEEVVPQQQEEAQAPRTSLLDSLHAELAEARKKFDNGDLYVDDYYDEREKISRAIVKEEIRIEEIKRAWTNAQINFLNQNEYLRENDIIHDAFAMQVNKILNTPKGMSMTDDEVLTTAKQKVDAAFGRAPEPHKKSESPVKKAKSEAADTSRVPQSLRGIPVAEPHDVDGSKFAYLDKLSGVEFEAAIAKLSSDDAARWARSQ